MSNLKDDPDLKALWELHERQQFLAWYLPLAKRYKLDPNPDDPRLHYDYFKAWKAGVKGPDKSGHWPSKFKTKGHPRRYLKIKGQITDTKTGRSKLSSPYDLRKPDA